MTSRDPCNREGGKYDCGGLREGQVVLSVNNKKRHTVQSGAGESYWFPFSVIKTLRDG